jgi:hypothetical protein
MNYPVVNKAHIVPRCYLRRFAINDRIAIHLTHSEERRTVSIDDAAVRRRFYRRTRPDGTPIDDVEHSLAQLEAAVAPILQNLEDRWPLGRAEKVAVAEFFAFQAVRGPRWRAWHDQFTKKALDEKRRDPVHQLESGILVPLTQRHIDELQEAWLSPTERLRSMMGIASKLITIFASMRWDLLVLEDDELVLSDHPVVEWPMTVERRRPGTVPTGHGMLNVLEMRIPLSPRIALLLTWQEGTDGPIPLPVSPEVAANLNAFSVEQADKQWMHPPEAQPTIGSGLLGPVSPLVFRGYVAPVAMACPVRERVSEVVNSVLGQDLDGEVAVVSSTPGRQGIPSSLAG